MKYPISREFFPYTLFKAPMNPAFLRMAQRCMPQPPRFVYKDADLDVRALSIPVEGGEIDAFLLSPKDLPSPAPLLINYHGGGFVLEGAFSHYRIAMAYAKQARCRVLYVRYRLALDHPFPTPQEDCCAALCWAYDHAQELGVDRDRIAVGGDSAGGTLTAAVCLMARDRHHPVKLLFQLLVYPWLDARNGREGCTPSESYRRFTDTPMWNSSLSRKVDPLIDPTPENTPIAYRSPVEAEDHTQLPPAYIEVAEFDCLHDDGVLYASLLETAELHEVKGAMHGFDTKWTAPTSQRMIAKRAEYMRRWFWKDGQEG